MGVPMPFRIEYFDLTHKQAGELLDRVMREFPEIEKWLERRVPKSIVTACYAKLEEDAMKISAVALWNAIDILTSLEKCEELHVIRSEDRAARAYACFGVERGFKMGYAIVFAKLGNEYMVLQWWTDVE